MERFTTIFWDVDDTLLDFSYSEKYALTTCFHYYGREITEDILSRYSEINLSFWKRLELGEITKEELLSGRFAELFCEFQIEGIDLESFRLRYQEELGNVYCFRDDSLSICRALQGRVSQYAVTNGVTSTQKKKLMLSGLYECMDGVFISEEIGAPKPKWEFFDYCLAHVAERDKKKILLVGDSLTSDVKGAITAGIPVCWYRREGIINSSGLQPDYEINNLRQIFDLLEGVWRNQRDRN